MSALTGSGAEWKVGGLGAEGQVGSATGAKGVGSHPPGGFGQMLSNQLNSLDDLQGKAGDASRSLADGTATDPSSAVVAVERARLAMQLASQLRTKGIEAFNDVIHTQV